MENTAFALKQMGDNAFLFFLVIGVTFTIAFYNFCGVSVTRYLSSPVRAVVDNLRTIIVWVFFMVVKTNIPETFHWLQLIGFIVLVLGTLVYNEVLVIPFLGFNMNTKEAIKKREEEEGIAASEPRSVRSSFVHK